MFGVAGASNQRSSREPAFHQGEPSLVSQREPCDFVSAHKSPGNVTSAQSQRIAVIVSANNEAVNTRRDDLGTYRQNGTRGKPARPPEPVGTGQVGSAGSTGSGQL